MSAVPEHDHNAFAVFTTVTCEKCGKNRWACAMCGEDLHKCMAEGPETKLPKGFKVIPEFPEYMINRQCTVRHIESNGLCRLMRVSATGGALIQVRKDGKPYTRAAQDLRDQTFNEGEN